jgi:hypothetical protein
MQDKARQGKTRSGNTREDKRRQEKAVEEKTIQHTRQHITRQHNKRKHNTRWQCSTSREEHLALSFVFSALSSLGSFKSGGTCVMSVVISVRTVGA